MTLPVLLLLCMFIPAGVSGFSHGVPVSMPGMCETMQPGHGVETQPRNNAPFEIIVSKPCYKAGEVIRVTILSKMDACVPVMGLFLQVKQHGYDNDNYGSWGELNNDNYQLLDCFNRRDSAVSHSQHNQDIEVTFEWVAPSSDSGALEVVGTLIQSKEVFWVDVKSERIAYDKNCEAMDETLLPVVRCGQDNVDHQHSHEQSHTHDSEHDSHEEDTTESSAEGDEGSATTPTIALGLLAITLTVIYTITA